MRTRFIHFPANRRIGDIQVLNPLDPYDWINHAEAKGVISVSDDQKVCLVIDTSLPVDLSPLIDLNPNDIYLLEITSTDFDELELRYIEKLSGLRGLAVWETNIGDDSIRYITRLPNLEFLDIGTTQITDNGLKHLSTIKSLKKVSLLNNNITDLGVSYLPNLKKLTKLDLMGTKVTDDCIYTLQSMKTFKWLRIYDTAISSKGFSILKNALPNCIIYYLNSN